MKKSPIVEINQKLNFIIAMVLAIWFEEFEKYAELLEKKRASS